MAVLLQTRAIKTREGGRLEVPSVVAASFSAWSAGSAALQDGATGAIRRVPFIDLINERSCMYACVYVWIRANLSML